MSEEKDKPVLDEQTLEKLLEAAYVLQEYNRRMQEMELRIGPEAEREEPDRPAPSIPNTTADASETDLAPKDDYTHALAQIVETQHKIQLRNLELEKTLSLLATRVAEIAKAGGAAICILDGKKARYRAVAGLMTLPEGSEISSEKALSASCLRTGQVIRCADVAPEFLIDNGECLRRGIHSLIAVPVYHEGGVAGAMELYYATAHAFTDQDVHTCQLMAGLVTEALAREEELNWKKSLATERAVMMEALEKLKPNLSALVDAPDAKDSATKNGGAKRAPAARRLVCGKCGSDLVGEEYFCGKCGAPRGASGDYEQPNLQNKVASLWHLQEATQDTVRKGSTADAAARHPSLQERDAQSDLLLPEKPLADSIELEMPELFGKTELPAEVNESADNAAKSTLTIPLRVNPEEFGSELSETALVKPQRTDWSSAAMARESLEQLAQPKSGGLERFWRARRGDIYLAIAVILVAAVIRWGIWSSHSVGATGNPTTSSAGHRQAAPDADLSVFDRMLISLGLAEPPPAPEYKGNPETQVWVDLHTALYYCPGADLYGKTPKGRFASQRDAQLDSFEPASRKACE